MTLFLTIMLVGVSAGSLVLVARQVWHGSILDGLSSLGWVLLITIPFLVHWSGWGLVEIQGWGILWMGSILLLGDTIANRLTARPPIVPKRNVDWIVRLLLIVLFALSLGLALLHVSQVDRIPLLEPYRAPESRVSARPWGEWSPPEQPHFQQWARYDLAPVHFQQWARYDLPPPLEWVPKERAWGALQQGVAYENRKAYITAALLREQSWKLLEVPQVVKYAFGWVFRVFSVIGIVVLLARGRYLLAGGWFLVFIPYAMMSGAKSPPLLLTVVVLGGVLGMMKVPLRRGVYMVGVLCALVILAMGTYNTLIKPYSIVNYDLAAAPRGTESLDEVRSFPDVFRVRSLIEGGYIGNLNLDWEDYLLYRLILVPSEVAQLWYLYYQVPDRRYGWVGILPGTRGVEFVHPSRKLAWWAFRGRFPSLYGSTTHAYAAMDADAYAHFGVIGVLVVGVVMLVFRIALAAANPRDKMGNGIYGAVLILLMFLPPIASMQAILVPRGLIFFLGGLLILTVLYYWPRHRTYT